MAVLDERDLQGIADRVELRIGRTDKRELIEQLVEDAAEEALIETNRSSLPYGLFKPVGDLAIVYFNRLGTEGDIKRTEGGESYEFEVKPKAIYDAFARFRLARVGGNAFEDE